MEDAESNHENYGPENDIVTIEMSEIRQPTELGRNEAEGTMISPVSPLVSPVVEGQEQSFSMVLTSENKMKNMKPGGSSANQGPKAPMKRVELCISDKVKVIEAASTGRSQRQLAKQFGISKTQVQCLLKRKEEILGYYREGFESWRKRAKLGRNSFEELNERVLEWYKQQTELSDQAITGPMIQAKAMSLTREFGLENVFKASNGWLEKFKRRFDLPRKNNDKNLNKDFYTHEGVTMVQINGNCTPKDEHHGEEVSLEDTPNQQNGDDNEPHMNLIGHHDPQIQMTQPYSMFHRPCPIIAPPRHAVPMPINAPTNTQDANAKQHNEKLKINTIKDALLHTAALKEFAVEKGSVTLIGLMTAMEHELQRENNT